MIMNRADLNQARREYEQRTDTAGKSGKQIELCVIASFRSLLRLAFGRLMFTDAGLQWGRVATNAERPFDLASLFDEWDELQWGRVLTNAERLSSLAISTCAFGGFNGAAFIRTRKGRRM